MKTKAAVLLNYNFKGGTGKTTLTAIESYILQSEGNKVLLIDFDIQQNLTEVVKQTYNDGKEFKSLDTLNEAMNNSNLKTAVVHVNQNLDLVPNDSMTDKWFRRSQLGDNDRYRVLDNLIEPLKSDYDYIFIDVPPSVNDPVINAMFAADGISIVLQTQKMAYTSALKTVQYLAEFREEYKAKFSLLGIIIYLYSKTKVSNEIANKAKQTFSGGIYRHVVKFQERVNGFMMDGISTKEYWDKRVIDMYKSVTDELVEKVKALQEDKE